MTYRIGFWMVGLTLAPLCRSAPIVVPPYTFSGFAATSFISVFPNYDSTLLNFVAPPPLSSMGGSGETSANLTYGSVLFPLPQLFATASVSSNNILEGASANLLMELDYFLIADGPGPVVTVDVSGFGNSTFPGESFLGVVSPPGFAPITVSSPLATSWVLNTSFSATVGIPYEVRLVAQISLGSAGDGLLTQSTLVDPILTIDPGFPDAGQYRLYLSPGIGNGDAAGSPVPEPSYAGLIVAVAGLSLVWKRRRIMM